MEESKAIIKLSEAKQALAVVKTIEDAKEMLDQAHFMMEYTMRRKFGEEIEQDGREIKLRAERILGQILVERSKGPEALKGRPKKPDVTSGFFVEPEPEQKPLSAYGITHKQASRYKKNAEGLTEQEFEEHIVETRQEDKPLTAQGVYNKADGKKLGYVGSQPRSKGEERDSNAWYTPPEYIECIRQVLGDIRLDPFSSALANRTVNALNYYSIDDTAYEHTPWDCGPVFMNPPYGRGDMDKAVQKFLEEFDCGSFDTAIVLTNNATETGWFQDLAEYGDALCFTRKRIAFVSPDNKAVSGNTRGQTFFYFGDDVAIFREHFETAIGCILTPCRIKEVG